MSYLCPRCRSPLRPGAWECEAGHRAEVVDGVLRLIAPEFAAQLASFLPAVQDYRSQIGRRLLDPTAYPELPFGAAVRGDREWEQRQYDLAAVGALVRQQWPGGGTRTVLDIGAYNGWLGGRLGGQGHSVTGVDVFTDAYDGLGAWRHYAAAWEPVQLDVRDLSLLDNGYEVVVLNRCLAFAPEPVEALRQAQRRVAPGGLLIALGLQIFHDPRAKARQVAERDQWFQQHYGRRLFLWPTRGYLDDNDGERLRAAGLILRPYAQLWWPDVKARLRPTLPRHFYGVWTAAGG